MLGGGFAAEKVRRTSAWWRVRVEGDILLSVLLGGGMRLSMLVPVLEI